MEKTVNYIFCDPQEYRFYWQELNYVRNLIDIGVSTDNIYILNLKKKEEYAQNIVNHFPGVHLFEFEDRREQDGKQYAATLKPWLMWQFFEFFPDKKDDVFFYTDSDIILSKKIEVPDDLDSHHWYGSDCNSYLGIEYINSKNYQDSNLLSEMTSSIGLDESWVIGHDNASIGAQYIMTGLSATYWKDVYDSSIALKKYLDSIEPRYLKKYKKYNLDIENPVQKWCAEMWATLWVMGKHGITPKVSDNLKFCWIDWKISDWTSGKYSIMHDAGVTSSNNGIFYKYDYANKDIFKDMPNLLNRLDKGKCGYAYALELNKTGKRIKAI